MNRSAPPSPFAEPEALDAVLAHEHRQWQSFYDDRARRCPFFVDVPDENLVEWVEAGRIAPGRALDLGCGNGRNARFLARNGFTVDAVDQSASAIAWARERSVLSSVPIHFTHASVFDLAIEADTYGLVYDAGCFHHIAPHRRTEYIARVSGALRVGGRFGLTCFRPEGGSGYSDEEVYERGTLGGGLGFGEERLRALWSPLLRIHVLRQMRELAPGSDAFGKDFLWALLASKP